VNCVYVGATSDRNGYPGTQVPVLIPVTRVPVRYQGTMVALITRLHCEISESSVFMYRLRRFKVTRLCTVPD